MVIVIISMLTLLASVAVAVDAGYLYSEHARLVTAADAAAVAGATELIESDIAAIAEKAVKIAKANDVAVNASLSNISYSGSEAVLVDGTDKITVIVDKSNKQIKVTVEQKKELFFARAIGISDAVVNASARAKIGQIDCMYGLIPIGIDKNTWDSKNPGDKFQIKFASSINNENKNNANSDVFGPGNYGAVDFTHRNHDYDNNTGSDYRDYLREGYQGPVIIGDAIYTETGVRAGSTEQGINEHIGGYVYAPVVDTFEVNGKSKIVVTGFAIIRITPEGTEDGEISVEKIGDAVVRDPGKSPWVDKDTGVWSVKLID